MMVIAIAVVLASIASYGVYLGIQRMPVREVTVQSQPVVVAARALPVGSLLTTRDVKVVNWPSDSIVPGGFTTPEEIADRGLMASLQPNEPVTESKLAPRGVGAGLPPSIPAGMRAVSVRVNDVIGVAGFTVPGTRVDVLVTVSQQQDSMARIVVSNVEVLTAGTRFDQDAARQDGKPIPSTVVTLLTTPQDAERVALASTEGQILLTLRNPLDTLKVETEGVRMRNLMAPPAPPPVARTVNRQRVVVAQPPPAPQVYTVETIRAAERTQEVIR
jgi:pilus assembly protein CpaB